MPFPANNMYKTAVIKTTKNYYRVLADDEPADNDEEFADEKIYIEP